MPISSPRLHTRLLRLEQTETGAPSWEASLAAEERLSNPPHDYTAADRRRDEDTLARWCKAAAGSGLFD